MIFLFFKPLKLKEHHFVDLPQVELQEFRMYLFTPLGLETYMVGSKGLKYEDRFIIKDINYTDKSSQYRVNMRAKEGIYKDDIITLQGDVVYSRDDGFEFLTQKLLYNKKSDEAISSVGYSARIGNNRVKGSYIRYNNRLNRVFSKNIDAIYQLEKEK
ncbi:hypothetical protein MNB_SM-5-349 [hydrothermal vent metagenome]|uniref:LPS export ABC transporter periplasmic protein LptC n=1 Tax=hydrothermal vent metagenome TaxID=652676 RepID=A0A1W1CSB5_9ZZZZ